MGKINPLLSRNLLGLGFLIAIGCLFYYKTFVFGLLPVPTDILVGRYHPWKDAFLAEYSRGFPYKNFLITDPIRQQIVWRKEVIDSWKAGTLPGWDPLSFGGSPLDINIQSGAWYPLNLLFLFLPFEVGWTALIISQTLGLLLFSYIFLRNESLRISSAVLGSVIIGFSGFSITWLTWGTMVSALMWLPLLLTSIRKLLSKRSFIFTLIWMILLVFSGFATITAGHLQIAFYVIFTCLGFFTHLIFNPLSKRWFYPVIAGSVLVGLIFSYLSRLFEFLNTTVRGASSTSWQDTGFFIPIQHLIQFLVPDYFGNPSTMNYWGTWNYGELTGYVGLVGITLAIVGMISAWNKSRFWIGWLLVCLLLSTANPLARIPFQLAIPFLSSLQPTRLMAIIGFCFGVLAAYGWDAYLITPKVTRKILMKTTIGVLVGVLLIVAWTLRRKALGLDEWAMVSLRNEALPLLFALLMMISIFLLKTKKMLLFLVLVSLLVVDLFRFGWKFTPFTQAQFFFPPTKILSYLQQQPGTFRVLALDTETAPANSLGWYGIETLGGYNPIYTKRYARFIHLFENGSLQQGDPTFQRLFDPSNFSSPLTGISNVAYALTVNPQATVSAHVVMQEGETYLLKKETLPRWYFADRVISFNYEDDVLSALATDTLEGFPAFVEANLPNSGWNRGTTETMLYQPNRQVIETNNDNEGFLVNSTAWDTRWHAYIDGVKTKIERTNYLFMGIIVPEGNHQVDFVYH